MYQKILLAVDGSEHASRAAMRALHLVKELKNSTITICYVSKEGPTKSQLLESHFDVTSVLGQKAYQVIQASLQAFDREGVPYRLEVLWGEPAYEIVELSRIGSYDLIILGSRGLGRFTGVFLGSVSQRVLQEAPCPVMIVK
ncbi:universal stress protein [Ammoniphilus resinae]|uniref:Nucleotide-binding universal stress UspA family protein n=1 Tax=Ammoniphilus resinae TaxID=861532 RepID=A0ABS4GX34_9BACL|nr:universal stress protein [Ammoniphilus resinae]MBP1934811.1 nucleotide-binding universal stress UspA family protein [Ammoniphilus resinae]